MRYEYKGLNFSLIPTQLDPNIYNHYIRGSLHKFKNDGFTNADDFTLSDIIQVVNGLKRYHVEPTNAILENLEFGVNIKLPFSCDTVLSRMVSGANRKFKEDEVFIKRVVFDRFEVKIYDKGRIGTGKISDLLRIELRVKKMDCINNVVTTLADLTDAKNLNKLGGMLVERLESIVMHDENLDQLTHYPIHIQLKIKDWINPNFWANLTPLKRFNEQKAFAEFQKRTNTGTIKNHLINAVSDKWDELLNILPPKVETDFKNGNGFSNVCTNILPPKVETDFKNRNGFSNVCTIKINGTFIKEEQQMERGVQGGKPNITNLKSCDNCGVDISHLKNTQRRFCSVKCKNAEHNAKRERRKATPSVSEPNLSNHVPKATPSVSEPNLSNHVPKATATISEPNLSNLARFDIMAALSAMADSKKM